MNKSSSFIRITIEHWDSFTDKHIKLQKANMHMGMHTAGSVECVGSENVTDCFLNSSR